MDFFDKNKAIICFLRHGQTDWNLQLRMQGREEVPLNEAGIAQAHECARGLKEAMQETGLCWDKIISSPLSRAVDTAKIIKDAVECGYFDTDERIIERDFGELSGVVYDEFSRATFNNVPEIKTVEEIDALMQRTNDFIKDRVKLGERVLIVTHGAITRIFARNAKKAPHIPEDYEHSIGNCHLVVYSYDGKEAVLEAYNIAPNELSGLIRRKNG